jgi:hypothetical protein
MLARRASRAHWVTLLVAMIAVSASVRALLGIGRFPD